MTKNILLVEYDESTIHTIKGLFQPPTFELAIAGDGETAKKLLGTKSFDLMITAAMLPRFHGFNLALAVSQDHPGMKIIIISAIYKGLEYRHQATTQYRANDFFEKPLDKEKFRNRVLELLNMSEGDLVAHSPAAATQVPKFATATIPAAKMDDEGGKLSSADIFGDIIAKIETVPEYEIDLGDGPKPAAKKADAPKPDPGRTVLIKSEPPRPVETGRTVMIKSEPPPPRKSDPGRTRVAEPVFDLDSLRVERKPAPAAPPAPPRVVDQKIGASLDGLRTQQVKREVPKDQRKIEDDIARKFEDTLSGLGLQSKPPKPAAAAPAAPAAPRPIQPQAVASPEIKLPPKPEVKAAAAPAPPPFIPKPPQAAPAEPAGRVIVKEIQETFADEVIDLGEMGIPMDDVPPVRPPEILRVPAPAPPPPPAAPEVKETREEKKAPDEAREAKPDRKPAPEDNPNEVGDYVLLGLIARGGMAEIYKAKKKGVKGFEKVIAIKKILSGYGEDDKYIEMLVDEAKIAAELSHPNIVQIYDLGRKDNYYFIAMEYVLGKDLREVQTRLREQDKWFPEDIAIFLAIKILEALNYAHKAKDSRGRSLDIVHRDVSPPNILISYNGDVKLTDFGVSKASIKIHQTLSGALKGKLLYMSPEQACGESTIDYRSDLYSVGVVLFELLTGKKLFLDTSEMSVLKKVQNGEIFNPRDVNPDIDPMLEKIVLTSLNKDCDKRYQSAAAMIADLEAFVHKKYDRAPGPLHLSHFIYGLFTDDIRRDGVKVELKPLPFTPKVRESVKPPPPPERPKPVVEIPAVATPAPPPPLRIELDEEKPVKAAKEPAVAKMKPVAAQKAEFKPESLFQEIEKEKKKFPLLPIAAVVLFGAIATGLYFFVIKKPAAPVEAKPAAQQVQPGGQTDAQKAEMKKIADQLAATQKLLDEAKLKQEEELKKIKDEDERKKLLEERRKKAEADQLKKTEEERLKKEEEDRLKLEEENRIKAQEEQDRAQKAEEERKKAEELKRAELLRVKEGDVVPLGDADVQPVAVSQPQPNIPDSIRSSMPDSQSVTFTVLIDHNGNVETVRMLRKTNNAQLNSILLDLVKTYKFQPAQKNSVRVKVWKSISMSLKK